MKDGKWAGIAATLDVGNALPAVPAGGTWKDAATTWNIGGKTVNVVYFIDPDEVIEEIEGPVFSGSFISRGYTNATFSASLAGFAETASSATLTLSLYADEGHRTRDAFREATFTENGSASVTFEFYDLIPGATYYPVLSGTDSNGTAGTDVVFPPFTTLFDPGYWVYDAETQRLLRGNIMAVNDVTADGKSLTIGNNRENTNPTLVDLDLSIGIEGGYSVVAIAKEAFYHNSALTNAVLPDSVTTLGDGAFDTAANLVSFVANGLERLPAKAVAYCTKLALFSATNLVEIGNSALDMGNGNNVLVSVGDLPKVTTVGASAFKNNRALESIVLPSIVTVGSGAFEEQKGGYCPTNIVFGAAIDSIGPRAFAWHNKSNSPLHIWFHGAPDGGFDSTAFENCASGVHTLHLLYSLSDQRVVEAETWARIAKGFDAANELPEADRNKWDQVATTWNIGGKTVNVVYCVDPNEQFGTMVFIY